MKRRSQRDVLDFGDSEPSLKRASTKELPEIVTSTSPAVCVNGENVSLRDSQHTSSTPTIRRSVGDRATLLPTSASAPSLYLLSIGAGPDSRSGSIARSRESSVASSGESYASIGHASSHHAMLRSRSSLGSREAYSYKREAFTLLSDEECVRKVLESRIVNAPFRLAVAHQPSVANLPSAEPSVSKDGILHLYISEDHFPPLGTGAAVLKPRHVKLAGGTLTVSKLGDSGVSSGWFVVGKTKLSVPLVAYFRMLLVSLHGFPTLVLYPRNANAKEHPTLYFRAAPNCNPDSTLEAWRDSLDALLPGETDIIGDTYAEGGGLMPLGQRHLKWLLKASSAQVASHLSYATQELYTRHIEDWVRLRAENKHGDLPLVKALVQLSSRLSSLIGSLRNSYPDSAAALLAKLIGVAKHLQLEGNLMGLRQFIFAVDDHFHCDMGFGGLIAEDPLWGKVPQKKRDTFMKLLWLCLDADSMNLMGAEQPHGQPRILPVEVVGGMLESVDKEFEDVPPGDVAALQAKKYASRVLEVLDGVGVGLKYDCPGKPDCSILDDLLQRSPAPSLAEYRRLSRHRLMVIEHSRGRAATLHK